MAFFDGGGAEGLSRTMQMYNRASHLRLVQLRPASFLVEREAAHLSLTSRTFPQTPRNRSPREPITLANGGSVMSNGIAIRQAARGEHHSAGSKALEDQPGPRGNASLDRHNGLELGIEAWHAERAGKRTTVGAFSVQLGPDQSRVAAELLRLSGRSKGGLKGEVELLTARAKIGTRNSDGSVGVNIGAMATAAAAEGTWSASGWSLTLGASASVGFEASAGDRDADHDGKHEQCVRVALGPVSLGGCVEWPF